MSRADNLWANADLSWIKLGQAGEAYTVNESRGYHRLNVQPGDIFLDLGAHIGCSSIRAVAASAKQVFAFEADPQTYSIFTQNVASFPEIVGRNAAVYGGSEDAIKFKRTSRSSCTRALHKKTQLEKNVSDFMTPRVDFQHLLDVFKPTVLKVDIEGSELTLDWSYLPPSIRSLAIELHYGLNDDGKVLCRRVFETIEGHGFNCLQNNELNGWSASLKIFHRR